jgi:CRP-like cAMP-binding protein
MAVWKCSKRYAACSAGNCPHLCSCSHIVLASFHRSARHKAVQIAQTVQQQHLRKQRSHILCSCACSIRSNSVVLLSLCAIAEVLLHAACNATQQQTDRLSRGDAFGDLALMTGEPHFATYRAASKSGVQLLVMSQALFETYMDAGVSKQAQVLAAPLLFVHHVLKCVHL